MHSPTTVPARPAAEDPPRVTAASNRRRIAWSAVAFAGCVGLFVGYLRMARTAPVNADGASLATQSWEMLHGNLLLRGWTVSDVSFYSTELVQYALVELVHGYRPDSIHAAAAMTYTLLVVLAAMVARGRATGRAALARVAVVLVLMLLPDPGNGYIILLGSSDHFGTAVPLLITWLVLDRATDRQARPGGQARPGWWSRLGGQGRLSGQDRPGQDRPGQDRSGQDRSGQGRPSRQDRSGWGLPALIAVLLAWGQVADPLVMYIGALPLVVVSALRLWRRRGGSSDRVRRGAVWSALRRSLDARLLVAGVASVVLAQALLAAHKLAGGFHTHSPPLQLSPHDRLDDHLILAVKSLALLFGGYLPDLTGPVDRVVGLVQLAGLLLVTWVVGVAAVRLVRTLSGRRRPAGSAGARDARGKGGRAGGDRVVELLTVGILVNLGAFVVSTLPVDLMSARQISAVLPMGAALAGRLCGRKVLAWRLVPAVGVLLVLFAGVFVARSLERPAPDANADIAVWLQDRGLTRGLGGYWNGSTITLASGGRVHVAPVTGGERIMSYRWESRADWYDPARHDARFLVLDRRTPVYGTIASATAQFGEPIQRRDFGDFTVLVYDHNLLVGLPAYCLPHIRPSMAQC